MVPSDSALAPAVQNPKQSNACFIQWRWPTHRASHKGTTVDDGSVCRLAVSVNCFFLDLAVVLGKLYSSPAIPITEAGFRLLDYTWSLFHVSVQVHCFHCYSVRSYFVQVKHRLQVPLHVVMPANGAPTGWDQLQPVIRDLYLNKGLTANEVLAKLKKEHAFNAK